MRRHGLYSSRMGLRSGWQAPPRAATRPTYALRDLFLTSDASPLASPRSCEPGPGALSVRQLDGAWDIAAGELLLTPQATPTTGDLALTGSAGFARSGQPVVMADVQCSTGAVWSGFWNATPPSGPPTSGMLLSTDEEYSWVNRTSDALMLPATSGTRLRLATQLKPAGGAFHYLRMPSVTSGWVLLGHDFADATATLYPGLANDTGEGVCRELAVYSGVAAPTPVLDVASPTTSATYTGAADGVYEARLTIGASPSTGDFAAIHFRHASADDHWTLRLTWLGDGTSELAVEEVSDGQVVLRNVSLEEWAASQSLYVQFLAVNAAVTLAWRSGKTSAEFHTGGGYGGEELTAKDGVDAVRLDWQGAFSLSELSCYRARSEELPDAN